MKKRFRFFSWRAAETAGKSVHVASLGAGVCGFDFGFGFGLGFDFGHGFGHGCGFGCGSGLRADERGTNAGAFAGGGIGGEGCENRTVAVLLKGVEHLTRPRARF